MLKFRDSLALSLMAAALMMSAPARAASATDQVTVLTIIDVVPDYAMPQNVEASAALLAKLAEDAQHAPGVVSFKILRDATRSNHFVIDGVWKDRNAFDTYTAADSTKAFRAAFQPRQGGPFDERVYVDLK